MTLKVQDSIFKTNQNELVSPVADMPKVNFESYEYKQFHGNKFAFITLNDTKFAKDETTKGNSSKFSVYIGNGREPYKSSDGNSIAFFDPSDDNQESIAAQFHVTAHTNISTKNLIKNGGRISNRSAIKGRADVVELKGNEMVIINSGAISKNSGGFKTSVPGGVHIYSGNPNSKFSKPSQPMVLGRNLEKALEEIYNSLQSLSSNITDINIEIFKMKLALTVHFHPPLAPPSPTLAVQFPVEMGVVDTKRLINGYIDMINHQMEKLNRVIPISKSNILSRYNTVN